MGTITGRAGLEAEVAWLSFVIRQSFLLRDMGRVLRKALELVLAPRRGDPKRLLT